MQNRRDPSGRTRRGTVAVRTVSLLHRIASLSTPFAAALLTTTSGGCLTEADAFAARGAKLACVRLEACDSASFESQYSGDRAQCRADIENNSQFAFGALEAMGCEYQPEQARRCIRAARRARKRCDAEADADIDDACANVFDCAGAAGD